MKEFNEFSHNFLQELSIIEKYVSEDDKFISFIIFAMALRESVIILHIEQSLWTEQWVNFNIFIFIVVISFYISNSWGG